ncbi:GNAT family N-acetyltransferase [Cellvibrio fontiphilus]|uniref:GNAT family N-acetyltransferase n=1 Tax=Cellvibrio fontiphilus TaxID=1815559 RepID=A0ABV7FH73_9GAMM
MPDIQHQPEQQRFVLECDNSEAILSYRLFSHGTTPAVDFTSTYVPPQCRGKGFAEKLVRTGIKWAQAQGFELHASCWYVAKFIR